MTSTRKIGSMCNDDNKEITFNSQNVSASDDSLYRTYHDVLQLLNVMKRPLLLVEVWVYDDI